MENSSPHILAGVYTRQILAGITPPPEMCDPRRSDQPYDEKLDLWPLGVFLYDFLVGEAPFEDTPVLTQRKITWPEMSVPPFIIPQAEDLIEEVSLPFIGLDIGIVLTNSSCFSSMLARGSL